MGDRDRMTLAEQTARRLILAGIAPDDPGLVQIRAWNARVFEKTGLSNPHVTPVVTPQ